VKLNQPHPNASYSANIYYGVCTDPSGEAAFKLNNVQNGASTTDLPVSLSTFTQPGAANYAIIVRQSADTTGPSLACGDFTGAKEPQ
jgi:hypothetical protein